MGEYEPNDSRNVTQRDGHAPGEPPRTGPREGEARRRAEEEETDEAKGRERAPRGTAMPEAKQRGQQSQGQGQGGGQRQMQGGANPDGASGLWGDDAPRAAAPGDPDRQDMQSEPGGALAGDQRQAIDNPAGSPTPSYDQYEVNQPQNMHQGDGDAEDKVRRQAAMQEDGVGGFGYGADGGEEMADAPDASERSDEADGDDAQEDGEAREEAEERGYGGRGEAEREAYERR